MNSWKKIASALMALTMTVSLGTTAFASDGPGDGDTPPAEPTVPQVVSCVPNGKTKDFTISIDNAHVGATYKIYKVFDATVSEGEDQKIAYTFDGALPNELSGVFQNIGSTKYVEAKEGKSDTDIFEAVANYAATQVALNGDGTKCTATPLNFEVMNGYYYITSSLGTKATVGSTLTSDTQHIKEKNVDPTIEKTGDNATETKKGVGDTISYTVVVHAKPGAENYVVTDTMTSLKLNATPFTVKVGETPLKDTDYTLETTDKSYTLSFTQAYLNSITTSTDITISYTATITSDAITTAAQNTVSLKYGHNKEFETTDKTVSNTTYGFNILKYDGADTAEVKTALNGAEFRLYDAEEGGNEIKLAKVDGSDNLYIPTKTGDGVVISAGTATVKGLADLGANKTYWLEEVTAPAGYNKLTERWKVENLTDSTQLTPTNNVVEVENNTGAVLPSTGGIGTTIFYVGGGILIAAAGILLVTKKRMSAAA